MMAENALGANSSNSEHYSLDPSKNNPKIQQWVSK